MGSKKAAVIGSGFGGISVALRLQALGYETHLYEAREKPGGRAYVYEDQGYKFDMGPTVVTDPTCLDELFELFGKRKEQYVELMPVTPLYRLFWEDGTVFDYQNDLASTREEIQKLSPQDVEGYEKFLEYTGDVFHEGYEKLGAVPFLSWSSMLKCAPQLVRLQAYRSVYSMVSKFIKHERLREAFSFHSLLVGGNPFKASSIYTLIHFLERKWGVFFPRGGTSALVQALLQLFKEHGGTLHLNTPVDRILTDQGRVTGIEIKQGKQDFDIVVSNADVVHTYKNLLKWEPRVQKTTKRLLKMSQSMSLFLVFFGTNKKFPALAHHNVIFGPRYEGLLKDIFETGQLADDFSLYLHAPTHSDPTMAPEGGESFYVLSPVPHLGKSEVDWTTQGPLYAKRILDYLEQRYMPGLNESIVTQSIFTPLDFKTQLNAHEGSAFSLEPLLTQSAYFRVHNRDDHLPNLYFVGAGTHPGAGLPGVIGSAKATARVIAQDMQHHPIEDKKKSSPVQGTRLLEQAQTKFALGSKSFTFASRFFDSQTRRGATLLYAFCRHCDDQMDEVEFQEQAHERLKKLQWGCEEVFRGNPPPGEAFLALHTLVKEFHIPRYYVDELLEGMAFDAYQKKVQSFDDIQTYSYQVASTVGLMMCHIMGVSDEESLRHASDLGLAMQWTNISRDVAEDFEQNRVYLPADWLEAVGVDSSSLMEMKHRPQVFSVVMKLLKAARLKYLSARQGLVYLPFRASLAVSVASYVYEEIGRQIIARGPEALDHRVVVSPAKKAVLFIKGLIRSVGALWSRKTAFRPITLQTIWRQP